MSRPQQVNVDRMAAALKLVDNAYSHVNFLGTIDSGRKWQVRFNSKEELAHFLSLGDSILWGCFHTLPGVLVFQDVRAIRIRNMPSFLPATKVVVALEKRPEVLGVCKHRW